MRWEHPKLLDFVACLQQRKINIYRPEFITTIRRDNWKVHKTITFLCENTSGGYNTRASDNDVRIKKYNIKMNLGIVLKGETRQPFKDRVN